MKLLVKLFIYWTIIAIVGIFNNGLNVQAKPSGVMSDVMNMNEPPPPEHELKPSFARIRRHADIQNTDEGDAPKDKPEVNARTRRQAPPSESDMPKEMQQDPEKTRAKRQLPPPPPGSEQIPMPFKK